MKFGAVLDNHLVKGRVAYRESWTIRGLASRMSGKFVRMRTDPLGLWITDASFADYQDGVYILTSEDMFADDWKVVKVGAAAKQEITNAGVGAAEALIEILRAPDPVPMLFPAVKVEAAEALLSILKIIYPNPA